MYKYKKRQESNIKRKYRKNENPMSIILILLLLILAGMLAFVYLYNQTPGFLASDLIATPIPMTDMSSRNQNQNGNSNLSDLYSEQNTEQIDEIFQFEVDNSALPWNLVLVNRYNSLDDDFVAPELFQIVGVNVVNGNQRIDARAADHLMQMFRAARNEGLTPIVISSYRSIERQRELFNNQLARRVSEGMDYEAAFEATRRSIAYPGTSEHNLGLALDIVSADYHGLTEAQAQTPEGIWLAQNAYRFGFILRYPQGKTHITGIIFEPWHFRYVGLEAAMEIHTRGITLEEYIMELQNFPQ